jgi:hydrogenase-4 component B
MEGIVWLRVFFWSVLGFYGLGALLPLAMRTTRQAVIVATICASLGSLMALVVGGLVLSGRSMPLLQLETNLPLGALSFHLDTLSSFFLAAIGLIALPLAIYSIGYLRTTGNFKGTMAPVNGAAPMLLHQANEGSGPSRRFFVCSSLFNLLLCALVVIVAADDLVVFLIGWEAMAFLSYMLVNVDYERGSVIRSGYLMLAISELGTVGIIIAFLLLAQGTGNFSYEAVRASAPTLVPVIRNSIFLLALFGFGAKIGVLPLQLWMPDAYHAAPDYISALLSAVLINLGIYGLFRVLFDFLGGPGALPVWWGLLTLSLGALTALVGILYSVVQKDVKRVLAYSSIENMGLILASIGASLTFHSSHLNVLAAIAAIVALYHMLNHAVYKGLLFLGSGSLYRATGSTDMAKLGGLLRLMPWTGLFFLIAALSIAAIPPFNGYISEWMLLETLLQSFALPDTLTKVIIALDGGILALTAGIAVTAFVRLYAVSFLGLPHSQEAESAHETSPWMRVGMGYLAAFCVLLGVLPTFVLPIIDRATTPLLGLSVLNQVVPPVFSGHPGEYAPLVSLGGTLFQGLPVNGLIVIAAPHFSTIDAPTYLFLAELLLIGLTVLAVHLIRPLGAHRIGPVWAGGIPQFTAAMTYTEVAYSNPIRLIFHQLYRSRSHLEADAAAAQHHSGLISYEQRIPPPFERWLYQPILKGASAITRRARLIQSGNINQYIAYIFLIVLVILILRAL